MSEIKTFDHERLKSARGDTAIEAVAVAAGVSAQTIRNWETGASEPPASKLAAIAAFLRKPIGFFFKAA